MDTKIIALLLLVSAASGCDRTTKPATASDIEWKHIFGKSRKGSEVYCLMASNFMGWPGLSSSPKFPDLDETRDAWLKQHPNAQVTIVREDDFGAYCWVIDGEENLNLHLVRKGCCEASTMRIPVVPRDVLISDDVYTRFKTELAKAELAAMDDGLGRWKIWKGSPSFDRADDLEQLGRFKEAIDEFKKVAEKDKQVTRTAWLRVGRCYDRLGQYADAIKAYDQSLQQIEDEPLIKGMKWIYIGEKAACIDKFEGLEKASNYLRQETQKFPADLEGTWVYSELLHKHKMTKEAIAVLEAALTGFFAKNEIQFDSDHSIIWNNNAMKHWSDVQALPSRFNVVANLYSESGDMSSAFKWASMALSIKQRPTAATLDTPELAEAGDLESRLIRFQFFLGQKSFKQAKEELDFAARLARAGFAGAVNRSTISSSYDKLRKQFPNERLEIPDLKRQRPTHPDK